jgi:TRAP-type mannitol/chloroaromatic compound transport system permease small subunit
MQAVRPAHSSPSDIPLWPLAVLAGLLPLLGTLIAWVLSMQMQLIPACNPFTDGCVSISRAARYDLPNYIFRAFMLPAAALQGLVWLLMAHWLHPLSDQPRAMKTLAALGLTAAVALVLYGAFLGTEGRAYRWLRQYGTVVYFGLTCLCLLIAGRGIQRAVANARLQLPTIMQRAMVLLSIALVMLGLGHAVVSARMGAELKDRTENVTEWWGSLIFVLGFCCIAWIWWRHRVVISVQMDRWPSP